MNKVENLLLEQMEQEKFHDVINDDFGFVDSLLDEKELKDKEDDA